MVKASLILLTIATLLNQGAHGQTSGEKFVPVSGSFMGVGRLEMRSEANVGGLEVRIRHICRWSQADAAVLDPIGDLVVLKLGAQASFGTVGLEQVKNALQDAGVNLAGINFCGSTKCTISRSDVEFDETEALEKWLNAKGTDTPATQPVAPVLKIENTPSCSSGPTLKEQLISDLAKRFSVQKDSMQVAFEQVDARVLGLGNPFQFVIEPMRARGIGSVAWNVRIIAPDGATQKVTIGATVRAWQEQVVTARPVATRQVIREQDVIVRRTLVDRLSDEPLLKLSQVIGQEASRELKPGMAVTCRSVNQVPLAKPGQQISVTVHQGRIQVQMLARALEAGAFGQTIRVKNEATKEIFQVTLTGRETAVMGCVPVASAQ